MNADRYKVLEGSESGHCCFEATVVDTMKPLFICGEPKCEQVCECFALADAELHKGSDGEPKCEQVCECFALADAERICLAMNNYERICLAMNNYEQLRTIEP